MILRFSGPGVTSLTRMNLRVSPARPRRGAIEAFDQHRAGLSRLPDFLDLEDGGEFALLGQDELGTSVFESALRDQIARSAAEGEWPAQDTERIILAAARVGQHVFALNVLTNCGGRCVFCGLNPSPGVASRMLLAGHIKPWKDSSAIERLDPRNGLAACPSHDVAFDTGMLTVTADLKIHIGQPLADAARGDYLTRQYYGRPPLLDTLLLPDDAERPRRKVPRLAPRESLRRLTGSPSAHPPRKCQRATQRSGRGCTGPE